MMKTLLSIVGLLFCSALLLGQPYPVTCNVNVLPPSSTYLPDYAGVGNEKLQVLLQLRDPSTPTLGVYLRVRIEGDNGVVLQTKQGYKPGSVPLMQYANLPVLGSDLASYLDLNNLEIEGMSRADYLRRKSLPEGQYTFCVTAFDYVTGVQVSNEGCGFSFLSEYDPPMLNLPSDGSAMEATTPQNVVFQWMPMHFDQPGNQTTYRFELWEVVQGRNPNELVLNMPPLYAQTLLGGQTTLVYGVMETPLDTGKTYCWRVQALDRDGRSFFKNKGYSLVQSFTYLPVGQVPLSSPPSRLWHTELNKGSAKLAWNKVTGYQGYRLEYRKRGRGNWHYSETTDTTKFAVQLEPGTLYEARVQGKMAGYYGHYSNVDTFRTPPQHRVKCGEDERGEPLPQLPPLPSAEPGMVFKVGNFELFLTEVSGGNGRFSGKGEVGFPFLTTIAQIGTGAKIPRFKAIFKDISVNTDRYVTAGEVQVVTHGWKDFVMAAADSYVQPMRNNASGPIQIDNQVSFTISGPNAIKLNTATGQIEIKGGPDNQVVKIPVNGDGPTTIKDASGTVYQVGKDGKVVVLGQTAAGGAPSAAAQSTVRSDLGSVVFANTGNSKGFLDAKTEAKIVEKFASEYKEAVLSDGQGGVSYATWKAVEAAGSDEVKATITLKNNSLSPDSVRFIGSDGLLFKYVRSGSADYVISLVGREHASLVGIVAQVKSGTKYETIGKLLMRSLKRRSETVVLVPFGGAAAPDVATVKASLEGIYKGAMVDWSVEVAAALPKPASWSADKKVEVESKFFPCYSADMREVIKSVKAQSGFDVKKYYLVVSGVAPSLAGVEGEMPRGTRFGFLFGSAANGRLVGHELAHGAFSMEHIFEELGNTQEKSTDNLLDWDVPGTNLLAYQWSDCHNPRPVRVPCLEGDEGGMSVAGVVAEYEVASTDVWFDLGGLCDVNGFVYLKALNNQIIKINKNENIKVNFNWLGQVRSIKRKEKTQDNKDIDVIYGFTTKTVLKTDATGQLITNYDIMPSDIVFFNFKRVVSTYLTIDNNKKYSIIPKTKDYFIKTHEGKLFDHNTGYSISTSTFGEEYKYKAFDPVDCSMALSQTPKIKIVKMGSDGVITCSEITEADCPKVEPTGGDKPNTNPTEVVETYSSTLDDLSSFTEDNVPFVTMSGDVAILNKNDCYNVNFLSNGALPSFTEKRIL